MIAFVRGSIVFGCVVTIVTMNLIIQIRNTNGTWMQSFQPSTQVIGMTEVVSHSNICPTIHYRKPFDPFTDFEYRVVTTQQQQQQQQQKQSSLLLSDNEQTTESRTTILESSKDGSSTVSNQSGLPNKTYFSSYHCVGTGGPEIKGQTDADSWELDRPNHINRACMYRNLYYRIADQSFHYFASPSESKLWKETRDLTNDGASGKKIAFDEHISRMNVTIGHVPESVPADKIVEMHGTPWRPILHESSINSHYDFPANISFAQAYLPATHGDRTPIFGLYHPFHSFNFGHLIWDDLLSLFTLIDRFGYGQDDTVQLIPLFVENNNPWTGNNFGGPDNQWRCSPHNHRKWQKCVKMYKRVFASLMGVEPDRCSGDILRTGNYLRGENNIGVWNGHAKDNSCWEVAVDEDRKSNQTISGDPIRIGNRTQQQRNEAPPQIEYILMSNVVAGTGRSGFFGCIDDCAIGRSQEYYRFRNFLFRNILGPEEACKFHQQPPKGYITFSLSMNSTRPDLVYHFENEIALARIKYGNELVKVVDMSKIPVTEQAMLVANSAVLLTNHGGVGGVSVFLPRGGAAIVFWHGNLRQDHNFYESAGYMRIVWIGVKERQWINRTMALIDDQVIKSSVEWSRMPKTTSTLS